MISPTDGHQSHHRKLQSASGDSISLDQYRDKKAVVLFFYPKARSQTAFNPQRY